MRANTAPTSGTSRPAAVRPGRDRRVIAVDAHDPLAGCRSDPVSSYWTSPLKPFAFSGTNARSMPLNIRRRPGPDRACARAGRRCACARRPRTPTRRPPSDAARRRPQALRLDAPPFAAAPFDSARRRPRSPAPRRARRAGDHVAGVGAPGRRAPRERALHARPGARAWPPRAPRAPSAKCGRTSCRTARATRRCARACSARPADTKMTWSTPASLVALRSGRRPAPACRSRRAASRAPAARSFTPSGASSALTISRAKPYSSRLSWNSSQTFVMPGRWSPNT